MRYKSIKISNFLVYDKEQKIEFPEKGNLFLVHGLNGSGKSSILHAFRFGLYGRTKRQSGLREYVPIKELINKNKTSGKKRWEALIEIKFNHENTDYKLTRKIKNKINQPTSNKDFDVSLELFQGSKQFKDNVAEDIIRNILHEDVSTFFLLDVEDIDAVEKRIGDEKANIKDQIENSLGITFLNGANAFLSKISDDSLKKKGDNEKASKNLKKENEKLNQFQKDLKRASSKLRDAEKDFEKTIKNFQKAENLFYEENPKQDEKGQRDNVNQNLKRVNSKIENLTDDIKNIFINYYYFPLSTSLPKQESTLRDRLRFAEQRKQDQINLELAKEKIASEISDKKCSHCGQSINDKFVQLQKTELDKVDQKIIKMNKDDVPDVVDIQPSIQLFKNFQDGYNIKRELLQNINSYYEEILSKSSYEKELKNLEKKLENISDRDFNSIVKDRDEWKMLKEKQEDIVESLKESVERIQEDINSTREIMQKIQIDEGGEIDKQSVIASGLTAIFANVSSEMISETRKNIDSYIKQVFAQLINDPKNYDIEVDDFYMTTMINKSKELIGEKSMGQKRIAAIALLASLSRQSISKAPIVIDSPNAGLDSIHQNKFYEFTQHLSDQVIVFATDREFDDKKQRKIVGKFLGGEKTIQAVDATTALIHEGRINDYLEEVS